MLLSAVPCTLRAARQRAAWQLRTSRTRSIYCDGHTRYRLRCVLWLSVSVALCRSSGEDTFDRLSRLGISYLGVSVSVGGRARPVGRAASAVPAACVGPATRDAQTSVSKRARASTAKEVLKHPRCKMRTWARALPRAWGMGVLHGRHCRIRHQTKDKRPSHQSVEPSCLRRGLSYKLKSESTISSYIFFIYRAPSTIQRG